MKHPSRTNRDPLKGVTLAKINKRIRDTNADYFDCTFPKRNLHPERVKVWVVHVDNVGKVFLAPVRVIGYADSATNFCNKRAEGMKVHGTYALESLKKHGFMEVTREELPNIDLDLESWMTSVDHEIHTESRFAIHPISIAKLSGEIDELADIYLDCPKVEQRAIKYLINSGDIKHCYN